MSTVLSRFGDWHRRKQAERRPDSLPTWSRAGGVEASRRRYHWARVLSGATVKLMTPQFVKPYVKSNKNDASDAEAICEAVARANMRFVPQKWIAQQDLQCLHRVRSRLVARRTQLHPHLKRNVDFRKIFLQQMSDFTVFHSHI